MLDFLSFVRDFNFLSIFFRIFCAMLCGGLVGLEREYKRRPAGFRTHILICVGASLTTVTSQYLLLVQHQFTDPARLGAQVIAGIGFIGAGTIIVTKNRRVKGLTTAAGLWVSGIVGLCCGAGYLEAAVVATVVMILTEIFLSKLEYWMVSTSRTINVYVGYSDQETLENVLEYLKKRNVTVQDMQITKAAVGNEKRPCAVLSLQLNKLITHDHLITAISEIKGVHSLEEL